MAKIQGISPSQHPIFFLFDRKKTRGIYYLQISISLKHLLKLIP